MTKAERLARDQAAMRARMLRAAAREKLARFDRTKEGQRKLEREARERRAFNCIGDYLRAQKRTLAIRQAGDALVTHCALGAGSNQRRW